MLGTKNQAFKGFETFWTSARMTMKMISYISTLALCIHLFVVIAGFLTLPGEGKLIYLTYFPAWLVSKVPWFRDVPVFVSNGYDFSAAQYARAFSHNPDYYNPRMMRIFLAGGFSWLLLPLSYLGFWFKTRRQLEDKHLRGSSLISEKALRNFLKTDKRSIAVNRSISMPFECEVRHVLAVGKSGAGKTQLFSRAINKIVERNDKAVINDTKGDYVSKFYDPSCDILFNPIDERFPGWTIFNEIEGIPDLESICSSMIPPSPTRVDPFWNDSARNILYSILVYCIKSNLKSNRDVFELSIADREELVDKFEQHPECARGLRPLMDSKLASNVLSNFAEYVKCFEYLKDVDGDFSIKRWIQDPSKKGRLFVTNYSKIRTTLRPVLSLVADTCIGEYLMLPEDINRRFFIILDELGSLQKLNSVIKASTLIRSYGGSLWIAAQDFGQIESVYGVEDCITLTNNCSNTFFFGVEDDKTAERISKRIGDKEITRANESTSYGVHDYKDGHSASSRDMTTRAVLPSEITALPDLVLYTKLSVSSAYTKIKLDVRKFKEKQPALRPINMEIQMKESNDSIDAQTVTTSDISQNFRLTQEEMLKSISFYSIAQVPDTKKEKFTK